MQRNSYADRLDNRTLDGLAIHVATPRQLAAISDASRRRTPWRVQSFPQLEQLVLTNLAHICETRLERYPASLEADTAALGRARVGSGTWAALTLRVEVPFVGVAL